MKIECLYAILTSVAIVHLTHHNFPPWEDTLVLHGQLFLDMFYTKQLCHWGVLEKHLFGDGSFLSTGIIKILLQKKLSPIAS